MQRKFVSEQVIDEMIDVFANTDGFDEVQLTALGEEEPMLLAYITGEQFELLTNEEKDLLYYLAWIVYHAMQKVIVELPELTEENLGEAEERNWELVEDTNTRDFRKLLDVFFENYPQEDLLAFVEDALVEDDEYNITAEGREIIFVGLKTLIDVWSEVQ
jgi:hypothetical protein